MKTFIDANLLIYLNVGSTDEVLDFWISLLTKHELYTDPLVLDETVWISHKKYNVEEEETISFLDEEILPYTKILALGEKEYQEAKELILTYHLKPSDALHAAAMKTNKITIIASEDSDFDKIPGIKRIWI